MVFVECCFSVYLQRDVSITLSLNHIIGEVLFEVYVCVCWHP